MALTFAFQYDGHIYLGGERHTRFGTPRLSPVLQLDNLCIVIKDPLYHLILSDEKERITIKNVHSAKMARMLYENIQDIIKNSKIHSENTEDIELNIIVCNQKRIFELGNPGDVREVEYAFFSNVPWSSESAKAYYLTCREVAEKYKKKFYPQKILKRIFSRYAETLGKIKIIKL